MRHRFITGNSWHVMAPVCCGIAMVASCTHEYLMDERLLAQAQKAEEEKIMAQQGHGAPLQNQSRF